MSMLVQSSEGWETYPSSSRFSDSCIDDITYLSSLLEEKTSVIFVTKPENIALEAVLCPKASDVDVKSSIVCSTLELHNIIEANKSSNHDWVFIISQRGTWSRLKLSAEMYKLLCQYFSVHPAFLEIVVSFGFKIEEQDEYFTSYMYRFLEGPGISYENFYNIKFVERHGRSKPEDPWSFRQYAVYHQYNGQTDSSVWKLIQPRDIFCQWLKSSKPWRGADGAMAPLYLHLRFLKSSSASWRWFLNYLSGELERIRVKVVCQTDSKPSYDSDEVRFSQSQSLELFQGKARRACSAIESTIGVVKTFGHLLDEITPRACNQGRTPRECSLELQVEIRHLTSQLETHTRKAREIVENVKNVNLLIQRTLDLRNYGMVHSSNAELRQISISATLESRAMLQLSDANRKDARIMKVASIIALVYLPASLVVSIFGSEFVHLDSLELDVRKGFGIFAGLVLTLTATTVVTAFLWIRKDAVLVQTKTYPYP